MVQIEERILNALKAYKDYNPPNGEEQFLIEVFKKTSEKLITVCKQIPYYKLPLIQKAIFSILEGWEIKTRTKIKDGGRCPIEYASFDIGYGIKEEAIKDGVSGSLHLMYRMPKVLHQSFRWQESYLLQYYFLKMLISLPQSEGLMITRKYSENYLFRWMVL